MVIKSEYFMGNEVSDYGIKNGYVDYRTLSKCFDHVLNNDIISKTNDWYLENGTDYDEENEYFRDIYQYYIISENGASLLEEFTNEIVYYSEELNMYLWGVTHFGTSWDYVLTDIKIEKEM